MNCAIKVNMSRHLGASYRVNGTRHLVACLKVTVSCHLGAFFGVNKTRYLEPFCKVRMSSFFRVLSHAIGGHFVTSFGGMALYWLSHAICRNSLAWSRNAIWGMFGRPF